MTTASLSAQARATKDTEEETIKVLLVDDHVLFRRALANLLACQKDIRLVGEAKDGFEAIAKAKEEHPDVVLMDIRMPSCDGLQATQAIKEALPSTKILVLTISEDDEDLFRAIKNGAHGYLLKDVEPEDFYRHIRAVLRGEAALSPAIATKVLREFRHQESRLRPEALRHITQREAEILRMVAAGYNNRDIATTLCLSESTVRNHLHNIMEKLHIQNRVQAAIFALKSGLASPHAREEI